MAAGRKLSPQATEATEATLGASYQTDHSACDCLHMSRLTPSARDFLDFRVFGQEFQHVCNATRCIARSG